MEEGDQNKVKAFAYRRISYDSDFEPEMETFLKNIKKDPKFNSENKKLNSNRFSRAIRSLIKLYNESRGNKSAR